MMKRRFILPALLWSILSVNPSGLSAQTDRDRSPFKVYLPQQISFCPLPFAEITADSIIGGTAPFDYHWWNESGTLGLSDTLIWQGSDTSTIWLEVSDAEGFRTRASTLAIPYFAKAASFSTNIIEGCAPLEIEFKSDYLAFQHLEAMHWDFGTGDSASTMASAVYTYASPGIFNPTLTLIDHYGCIWRDSLHVNLRVFPAPVAAFEALEETIYLPHSDLKPESRSIDAGSFLWSFGPYGTSQEEFPAFDLSTEFEGIFPMTLTVNNTFGCQSTYTQWIKVVVPISFFIPNAFSPDKDGVNDEWLPIGNGVDLSYYRLDVYDQWGTLLFQTNDITEPWDGKNTSTRIDVSPGIYSYRIIARDTEHRVGHEFQGHLTVLR